MYITLFCSYWSYNEGYYLFVLNGEIIFCERNNSRQDQGPKRFLAIYFFFLCVKSSSKIFIYSTGFVQFPPLLYREPDSVWFFLF